jgi:CarD family transcriptional regulator
VDFKVGQKVVYPTHGVAIVEQIEIREINGEQQQLYLLRLQSNQSLVMVPTRNVDEIGLRRLIALRHCDQLLSSPLSFREKQMLERARYLIISELSVVCRKSEANIAPQVDQALDRACHKHARNLAAV